MPLGVPFGTAREPILAVGLPNSSQCNAMADVDVDSRSCLPDEEMVSQGQDFFGRMVYRSCNPASVQHSSGSLSWMSELTCHPQKSDSDIC